MVSESISIILPVHNMAKQLHACLRVLEQTLPTITHGAFEVIVVDDASTDQSLMVLDDMRLRFRFLRVILHAHQRGLDVAAATGLSAASGDLLIVQESAGMVDVRQIQKLVALASDSDVLAARAEWRSSRFLSEHSLQMISRSALDSIVKSPSGSIKLVGETTWPVDSGIADTSCRRAA